MCEREERSIFRDIFRKEWQHFVIIYYAKKAKSKTVDLKYREGRRFHSNCERDVGFEFKFQLAHLIVYKLFRIDYFRVILPRILLFTRTVL